MAEAAISFILVQVSKIMEETYWQRVRLVREKELKKLESGLKLIKAVLVDAEERQMKEESVRLWLKKVKDICYDVEDVLDEWVIATRKAEIDGYGKSQSSRVKKVLSLFSSSYPDCWNRIALHRHMAIKIREINGRLDEIAVEKENLKFNKKFTGSECPDLPKSASFVDVSQVEEGRDAEKETLISKLLSDNNQEKGLKIISIVGIGGIGKTTLASSIYNSSNVIDHFDSRIWVCVSDPFNEVRIAKSILKAIEGADPDLIELETISRKMRNHLRGTRFLIVLDDVWTDDFRKYEQLFNSLKTGGAGSTILVTTRKESVARVLGSSYLLSLGSLSKVDSWSLFEKTTFSERKREDCERLEYVGRMIAEKCSGLPLAVKTIGGLLRFKSSSSDWLNVLNSDLWELEAEFGLSPSLKLSYSHLPPTLKPCFLYFALFPKNYVFEAKKLIQLWMAEGFLTSTENSQMEVIGQEYLQNLAIRSFFKDLVKDKDGQRILSFKMHDIVHDVAQYLAKSECSVAKLNNDFQRKMESSRKRTRHLTVVRVKDAQFPNIPNVEKLFTLCVLPIYDSPPIVDRIDQIEPDFIRRLACVRVLDLSRNRICVLPEEIGSLIKLRYLGLSHNLFWKLPETLCDLYNLTTLNLSACNHLRKLPSRISRLVNLIHLEIDHTDSLKALPKGIGDLLSLQALSKFIIIGMDDRGDATCGLKDLKHLNNLRGCLKIEGLGYAADADDAKKAELQKKIHLSSLKMDFSPSIQTGSQDEIIEALEVHENLQSLQIRSYEGTKFPNWMIKLTNLQRLILQDCQNCANLPPLGRLPSLETLHLEGMKSISFLKLDFLGVNVNDSDTSNGESGSKALSAFPCLKKLKISKMDNWEEWEVISNDRGMPDSDFKIMPRLMCLKISHCSKLKELPPLLLQKTPLRELHIKNCPLVLQHYKRETGENWCTISHIPEFRIS